MSEPVSKQAVAEHRKRGKGFVVNCLIKVRDDQEGPIFDPSEDGYLIAMLDSYAIIPIEEYHRLKKLENAMPRPSGPEGYKWSI